MKNAELKEAIAKYIESKELVLMGYSPEYIDDVKTDMEIAFRAGAEWMARQMKQEQPEVDFEDIEYLLNKVKYMSGYWIKTNPVCAEITKDFNKRLNARKEESK